jgi:putative protease
VVGPALQASVGQGLDEAVLRDKLGALGGTMFTLAGLTVDLPAGKHAPVSGLKAARRALVEALEGPHMASFRHAVVAAPAQVAADVEAVDGPAMLVPLVRTAEQLEAVIAAGCDRVELDWMELVGLQAGGRPRARGRAARHGGDACGCRSRARRGRPAASRG